MQIATIGYEGADLTDFIATLVTAGVEQVIDVREIAQSRRPGFSKNALRTALAAAGIDYHHERQLGDPKHGREAARTGQYELFRQIFSSHLDLSASISAIDSVASLVRQKKSVLVCYERDPKHCHRTMVAERISAKCQLKILHLGVNVSGQRGRNVSGAGAERIAGAC